jgi:hypothetical protein
MRDAICDQFKAFLHDGVEWHCPGATFLSFGGPWEGIKGTKQYVGELLGYSARTAGCRLDSVTAETANVVVARGVQVLSRPEGTPFPVPFTNTFHFDVTTSRFGTTSRVQLLRYENVFDSLEVAQAVGAL